MKSTDVLVLTQESPTLGAVRAALEVHALQDTGTICGTMMDLRARLAREPTNGHARVAVVDIDQDPDRILSELAVVNLARMNAWLVVLARDFDEKRVLRAMQAGARHFLRKSEIATDLPQVLEHLLVQKPQTPARLGTILAVFSCSGGCGATTVAVNLASELRLAAAERVLIVDLDPHYGAAATYLGVKGRYGIGHILSRQGAIDKHLIESTAVTHGTGLDLLLSPASAQADAELSLNYHRLLETLEACRESHDYVIVDAPRITRNVMAEVASVSRMNLIVFQLTIRDVTFARALISFLGQQGIGPERLQPLANRTHRRGLLLRLADGQRALGVAQVHPIRDDWARAARSANRGQPLCEVARRSRLRRDYQRLAAKLHQCTSNGGS